MDSHRNAPLPSIFLVGAATLLFEILLTRIFSVTMWYHFAFIAISLALFGISASGVVLTFRRPSADAGSHGPATRSVVAFAIVVPIAFVLDQHIPFVPFDMGLGAAPYLYFLAKFLVLATPFFFSGLTIAFFFRYCPNEINRIYFADLLGAGFGCALVAPVLSAVSAPSAIVLVSALLFLSAALLYVRREARRSALACLAAVIAVVLFVMANERWPVLRVTRVKSYDPKAAQEVERPKIYERWNPVSRVAAHPLSVSTSPQPWFYSMQTPIGFPKTIEITNDGGARTYVYPRMTPEEAKILFDYDLSDIAYQIKDSPEVLVIGIGGGKDILGALAYNCRSVTGVELNPLMIDLVQNELADFSGRPYDDPRVRIVIDEGRNFVASGDARYDVIKLSVTDTWATSAVGAYALVENYLYTREAIQDYLRSLKPGGILTISRWFPQESYRLTVLAADALRTSGLQDVERRICMNRDRSVVNFLIKNGVFTDQESSRLVESARHAGHTVIYAPGQEERWSNEAPDQAHRDLLMEDWKAAGRQTGLNLVPPVDDRPFFFNLITVEAAKQRKYGAGSGFTFQHGRALSLLYGMLIVSLGVVVVFVILPMVFSGEKFVGALLPSTTLASNLFFLSVGLGYLMVEIPLVQRLILFLGHPVYAMTVALFSMLVFSGLGSMASRFLPASSFRAFLGLFLLLLAVTVLAARFLPPVLHAAIGFPIAGRIAIAVLVIAPVGFLLGIPFPTGLSILSRLDPKAVSWAWAVNGAASVTAPVLAMISAIQWGFTNTFYGGAACYALAAILFLAALQPAARRS